MTANKPVRVSMIVAMAENRVIGRNNQLPWYLPNDLKYFKATTMGKPIVMGRKTYESIGRPLPGRTNIVVTGNADFSAEGVKVVHGIDEALQVAQGVAELEGVEELMVIGGAQLYADILPKVERLYLTRVHADVEGDARFPELDLSQWQLLVSEDFAAEGPNPYDYSFVVYQRAVE
ncbi:dihydrofolate reductase [Oceanicoccus sp. KOV_DT_Chl]|uniref:dihydrofolate reductase n=1 Tax=Oceanicoccus sp. KOV_DT_Chl TaxID=1904639 RepID=UPI000C7B3DDE|nr:dihydrofolate reductase [Oceanicoccus sp. KOV_DT_Chl]